MGKWTRETMELREGAMLAAATVLLSARHAHDGSGETTSTNVTNTSTYGDRSEHHAMTETWPLQYVTPPPSTSVASPYCERMPLYHTQSVESVIPPSYTVGYAPVVQPPVMVRNGVSQDSQQQASYQPLQTQQRRQEGQHGQFMRQQETLRWGHQQQQLQQPQRVYEQLQPPPYSQNSELEHRAFQQNHHQHQPTSQHTQVLQAQAPSQRQKTSQPRKRQPKNDKPQRQKQSKSNRKRKNQTNEDGIDEIVASAESQPEFAKHQYTAQLQHAPSISQDEVLARRTTNAVNRPGQSIVPAPYQRRPIDIDPRLRAIPGINGLLLGDLSHNARPFPAFRAFAGSNIPTKARLDVHQRFPHPSFPSADDRNKSSRIWSQISNLQQPVQLSLRTEKMQKEHEVLFSSLRSSPQQHTVNASSGPQLLGRETFVQSSHHMQPSHLMQGREMLSAPTAHAAQHPTSNQHSYKSPPQPEQSERRFEDSLWTDQEQRPTVARQIDSSLQGNAVLSMHTLGTTGDYSALTNRSSLLPSLEYRSTNDSGWYYPSSTNKKTSVSQTIKNSSSLHSAVDHKIINNDVPSRNLQQVGHGVGDQYPFATSNGPSFESAAMSTGNVDFKMAIPPDQETTQIISQLTTMPGKPISNNRLRKMAKQTRRQERKEKGKKLGQQSKKLTVEQLQALEQQRESQQNAKQPAQVGLQAHRPSQSLTANAQQPIIRFQQRQEYPLTTSGPRPKTVSATSSQITKARHADSKTALQREQEQLLRQAQLAMAAQQQLHQRNYRDFPAHARPLPTVVARSATGSAGAAVHKRSRSDYESQNKNSSTLGVRMFPDTPIPNHDTIAVEESSCGLDDKKRAKFAVLMAEQQTNGAVNASNVQAVSSMELVDCENANRIRRLTEQIQLSASTTPEHSDNTPSRETLTVTASSKRRSAKSRKRKASSSLAIQPVGTTHPLHSDVAGPADMSNSRVEQRDMGDTVSTYAGVSGGITISSAAEMLVQKSNTTIAVPEANCSRSKTDTVMIFCKRDFLRFQAGLLWKKYQEVKRKRDQTLATVTGRRTRYLNGRYKGSGKLDGETELRLKRSKKAKKRTSSGIVSETVEILDDEESEEPEDVSVEGHHDGSCKRDDGAAAEPMGIAPSSEQVEGDTAQALAIEDCHNKESPRELSVQATVGARMEEVVAEEQDHRISNLPAEGIARSPMKSITLQSQESDGKSDSPVTNVEDSGQGILDNSQSLQSITSENMISNGNDDGSGGGSESAVVDPNAQADVCTGAILFVREVTEASNGDSVQREDSKAAPTEEPDSSHRLSVGVGRLTVSDRGLNDTMSESDQAPNCTVELVTAAPTRSSVLECDIMPSKVQTDTLVKSNDQPACDQTVPQGPVEVVSESRDQATNQASECDTSLLQTDELLEPNTQTVNQDPMCGETSAQPQTEVLERNDQVVSQSSTWTPSPILGKPEESSELRDPADEVDHVADQSYGCDAVPSQSQTKEPFKSTDQGANKSTRSGSNTFNDGDLEYVIIEEDTFGDWSYNSAQASPTNSHIAKCSPSPSSKPEERPDFSNGAQLIRDVGFQEDVLPSMTVLSPKALLAPVSTPQVVAIPISAPVSPTETARGTEMTLDVKSNIEQDEAAAFHHEECLI